MLGADRKHQKTEEHVEHDGHHARYHVPQRNPIHGDDDVETLVPQRAHKLAVVGGQVVGVDGPGIELVGLRGFCTKEGWSTASCIGRMAYSVVCHHFTLTGK